MNHDGRLGNNISQINEDKDKISYTGKTDTRASLDGQAMITESFKGILNLQVK